MNDLGTALKHSRCIVCLWSPLYFRSKWCVSEWLTFVEREKLVDAELVMPASFFDGKNFPEAATARQFADFSAYASTIPRFWNTKLAIVFEDKLLKPFAKDLAAMIGQAPPFDEGFPIVLANDEDVLAAGKIERLANA